MRSTPATSVLCLPCLDAPACDGVLEHVNRAPWSEGRVALPGDTEGAAQEIRSCRTGTQLPPGLAGALCEELARINARHFGFDLTGPDPADPICAMRYEVGDHFDWHVDNGVAARPFETRKLAFSVQLTPPVAYDGGDLEFALYGAGAGPAGAPTGSLRRRGMLIAFAAFQAHRVTVVTRGTRTALVGWLHGPPFR